MIRAAAALLVTLAVACAGLGGCGTVAPVGATPVSLPDSSNAQSMRDDSSRYIVLAVDNPLEAPAGRAGSSFGGYGPAPRYLQGQRAADTLAALAREHGLREAAGWPITALGWQCVVFELPAGPGSAQRREALVAALARDPRVRLVQPLQDFDTHAAPAAAPPSVPPPADPGLPYNDPYVNLQTGFVDTGAARAHRTSTGAGVQVALIDTGVAAHHPDLQGRVLAQRDLVGDPGARIEADRHGTEVAGVIAAVGNNREGIVGIAPQAGLTVFRACWPLAAAPATTAATPAGARCNSFTLAKALAAALQSDARIVNLSLGGPSDPLLEVLLGELLRQGRLVVGALPPDGHRGGFPTGTPGVVAAAVSGGNALNIEAGVLPAPGRDVLTLQPGARYDYASGSSIAAAHVSGVAALLLAMEPRLDGDTLRGLLQGACTGEGRSLSAVAALDALRLLQQQRQRLAQQR